MSTAISSSGASRITATEASTRIGAWSSGYTTWVPQQTATTDGIFQAFSIPTGAFEVATSLVSLALKASGGGLPFADLVVTGRTSSAMFYDNMAHAIPPMLPLSNFYLLTL